MIQPILTNKLPDINALCKKHKVTALYAFGSVCTDHFNDKSDVDLLVNFERSMDPLESGERYWDFLFAMEKILNRKVDLLTEKSLSNPFFIEELNEKRIPLYGKAA